MKKIYTGLTAALIVALMAASASAAPLRMNFWNDFQADSIYLFIVDGGVTFNDVLTLPNNNWTTDVLESNRVVMTGDVIDPGSRFRIEFSDRDAFTLEWAEILDGTFDSSRAGSIYFNNRGNVIGADSNFTSAVPIPESLWLLGSGLICFVGVRRKVVAS